MNDAKNQKFIKAFKLITKILAYIIIILVLFFGSAGTFYWLEAWLLILFFLLYGAFFYDLVEN